jgi:RNA polymerase sigma-70 factor (ECF subfamily)
VSQPAGVQEVIRRAQAGDEDAFHALYREQVGRVYALCLRLTGDRSAAEELTQDVFVRAWQKLRTFRGESAFSTWLYRLATNVALMAQRSRTRRERRVNAVADPAVFDRGVTTSPGDRLDLEQALARLPRGAREVFVLHDVEGYGHAEIGQMLGIAAGTSKAQLFRARRLLREMLDR